MNFDFSEDQKLLQQTARDFLEEYSPLSVCREVLEEAGLTAVLARLGHRAAAVQRLPQELQSRIEPQRSSLHLTLFHVWD